jgi:hypothetical protein
VSIYLVFICESACVHDDDNVHVYTPVIHTRTDDRKTNSLICGTHYLKSILDIRETVGDDEPSAAQLACKVHNFDVEGSWQELYDLADAEAMRGKVFFVVYQRRRHVA